MVKDILKHIDSLKAGFDKLKPLTAENQQKLDKKFRLEWNYNSNHIEGNTLTYGETELLLIFDQTKGNHELREYEEMKGHDVALKLIYDLATDEERQLTEKFIRELNEILLVRPFYKEAITHDGQETRRLIKIGDYKSLPNYVRLANGEIFKDYASPEETRALMGDLMQWYNEISQNSNLHPVDVAAELHYKFVIIHPFDDGNGRISRLLMNYHLLKNNYPPIIIKSADKKNYLFALREADTGNIDAFKAYIAEQLIWSCEIAIKAAEGKNIDEPGDWEKKIKELDLKLKGNKTLEKIKSPNSIADTLINIAIPLFKTLLDKNSSLNKLFVSSHIYIESKYIQKGTYYDSDSIMLAFKDLINNVDVIPEHLQRIDFYYTLADFKRNGSKSFDIKNGLFFIFEKHSCKILAQPLESDNNVFILCEKLYHETFTEQDKDTTLNLLTETIIKQIEEKL